MTDDEIKEEFNYVYNTDFFRKFIIGGARVVENNLYDIIDKLNNRDSYDYKDNESLYKELETSYGFVVPLAAKIPYIDNTDIFVAIHTLVIKWTGIEYFKELYLNF